MPVIDKERIVALQERWRDPLLTALTIVLVILIFGLAPLHAAGLIETQRVGLAAVLVLIGSILFVSGSVIMLLILLTAFVLASTSVVLRLHQPSVVDVCLDASAFMILGIALLWVVGRAVFAPGRVTHHRIVGAILLYLTTALIFVALFMIVGLLFPDAFSGVKVEDGLALISNLIYFSFVTLTSTGYGDIVPVHPIARSFCNLESIIGQLYPATLLARLVTLELEGRRR
jgi:voltage-gated potassium channel Kch